MRLPESVAWALSPEKDWGEDGQEWPSYRSQKEENRSTVSQNAFRNCKVSSNRGQSQSRHVAVQHGWRTSNG